MGSQHHGDGGARSTLEASEAEEVGRAEGARDRAPLDPEHGCGRETEVGRAEARQRVAGRREVAGDGGRRSLAAMTSSRRSEAGAMTSRRAARKRELLSLA